MNGGSKKKERNTVTIKNQTCNHTCEDYIIKEIHHEKGRGKKEKKTIAI